MLATEKNETASPGQAEKELLARVYLNRRGIITRSAFSSSIYQGDKGILLGQPARAALVIPSRIFGFCGGSHQQAAAMALEHAWRAELSPNARALRSITQAAEILQNTSRWFYTTFAPSFTNKAFSERSLFAESCRRFTAFKGTAFRPGIIAGTYPMALYALFAGQWPHSNFILPGGVSAKIQPKVLARAFSLLDQYCRNWLEGRWLGGSLERYLEIRDWAGLMDWLDEKQEHYHSDFGLFVRLALDFGLENLGVSTPHWLSYGAFWNNSGPSAVNPENHLKTARFPSGLFDGKAYQQINTEKLLAVLRNTKGPHQAGYDGKAVEAGPLARMLAIGQPEREGQPNFSTLFPNILKEKGASVFVRAWARMHEACLLANELRLWLAELQMDAPCQLKVEEKDGWGIGLTEAPRGALAHFVETRNGQIKQYTIIPPTMLNLHSGEASRLASPLSQALEGVEIKDPENPIEVALVARSFDACLSCSVHLFKHRSEKDIARVQL